MSLFLCWNCIIFRFQSHCIGLWALSQSYPRIASYGSRSRTIISVWNVWPCTYHSKPCTCAVVVIHCPLANLIRCDCIGVVGRLFNWTKWELTKQWLLPVSTKISIVLFLTVAFNWIESVDSVPANALSESCPKVSVRASSMAISFSKSSLISLSRSFTAKALICGLFLWPQIAACPGSYFSPQA